MTGSHIFTAPTHQGNLRSRNDLISTLNLASSFGGPGEGRQGGQFQQQFAPAYVTQAASVNQASAKNPNQVVRAVKLSQIEAESKRLVLAFESRMSTEINWALNTLAIFSCNTSQNFTLENQPYLLESLANYLVFCI